MQVEVNGTRLWFDADGPVLVPDGARMSERPTLVLVHGGPATYDHSYFKPAFGRMTEHAQVVYVDLRGHGRSAWEEPAEWSFEGCADDLRALCDAVGIQRPVVLGHSMGSFVALLYAARHAGHAAGVVALSAKARFDLPRLVEGFRAVAGDEVARLARRSYGGEGDVTEEEWGRVFAAFGPRVPDDDELARRRRNLDLSPRGLEVLRRLDIVDELSRVTCPTLVCVGALDPVTPVAAAEEIVEALPAGVGRLQVLEGAGHFPWKDVPDRCFALLADFVGAVHDAGAASSEGAQAQE